MCKGPADPREWEHDSLRQQQQQQQTQSKCPVLPCSPCLRSTLAALLHWEELRMGGAADGRSCGWEEHRSNLDLERAASRPPLCPPFSWIRAGKVSPNGKGKAEVPAGVEVHRPPVDHCSLSLSLSLPLSLFTYYVGPSPSQLPVNVTHFPWALGSDVSMVQGMLI
ncbi:hypothetical protein Landi51_02116 [Colletotrichum acutatum]